MCAARSHVLAGIVLATIHLGTAQADDVSRTYFTDTVVLDQQSQPKRFYSDLLQGKTVIIHSFFATCHGACPSILGHMKAIQEHLGDRLGKDIVLLSITVNPDQDSPAKLRDMAESLNARPGWYFLSGKKAEIDSVLQKLGQLGKAKEDHSTAILIGNEVSGVWAKVPASARSEEIVRTVDKVSSETGN